MIINKNVSVRLFLFFLKGLPDCACVFDSLSSEENTDIINVFELIGEKLASYLHYEIFQCILNKYCDPREKDCDDFKYPEYLEDYIAHLDIKHFLEINSKLSEISGDTKKLCLKIDMDETTKITKIKDLESSIAKIFKPTLRPSELQLIDVKKGCLILTFLIPATAADAIFGKEFNKNQIEMFRSLSVLWLQCKDIKVDCREYIDDDTNSGNHQYAEL